MVFPVFDIYIEMPYVYFGILQPVRDLLVLLCNFGASLF